MDINTYQNKTKTLLRVQCDCVVLYCCMGVGWSVIYIEPCSSIVYWIQFYFSSFYTEQNTVNYTNNKDNNNKTSGITIKMLEMIKENRNKEEEVSLRQNVSSALV